MDYVLYVVDTETTGLQHTNDVIEASFYRLTDGAQKTWCIKPINSDNIEPAALRINGHKLEDLLHQTKYGRDTYKEASATIIEIENWIIQDGATTEQRVLVAQNTAFDKMMLEHLWRKCNAFDTFPFGRRYLDTMQIQFFLDMAKNDMADSYSLSSLAKKYGVKNERAHSAEADTKTCKEIFEKQVATFKKVLSSAENTIRSGG